MTQYPGQQTNILAPPNPSISWLTNQYLGQAPNIWAKHPVYWPSTQYFG